jgi:hypothetical protein
LEKTRNFSVYACVCRDLARGVSDLGPVPTDLVWPRPMEEIKVIHLTHEDWNLLRKRMIVPENVTNGSEQVSSLNGTANLSLC